MVFLHLSKGYYYICSKIKVGKVWKKKYLECLGKIPKEDAELKLRRYRNLTQICIMPKGKYNVIYADPPWRYEHAISKSRAIESHYPTMNLEDICGLKIPSDKNAVLFLWTTSPLLQKSFKVVNAWGFDYRTSMVWVKDKVGMGYYVRGQHEFLLINTKGETRVPSTANRRDSVFFAPVTGHSEKPEIVYSMIESMYPESKFLELFARNKREGWALWGLDIE